MGKDFISRRSRNEHLLVLVIVTIGGMNRGDGVKRIRGRREIANAYMGFFLLSGGQAQARLHRSATRRLLGGGRQR